MGLDQGGNIMGQKNDRRIALHGYLFRVSSITIKQEREWLWDSQVKKGSEMALHKQES